MTEAEWPACAEPKTLPEFLSRRGGLTTRKQRLFAVACGRRIWHLVGDERSRAAVDVAERLAGGWASDEERLSAFGGAEDATESVRSEGAARYHAACAAEDLVYGERLGLFDGWYDASLTGEQGESEEPAQAALVRDLFGNPFRPVAADPSWLTSDVIAIADGIYSEKAFDRLPVLADALQDAGCDDEPVVNHCRSNGPHVRGCWAIDLILGKQ